MPATARILPAIAATLLVCLASARAQADPPAAAPAPVPAPVPSPVRIDYDAPDPNRGVLNVVRAVANVGFENYVIWQIDWFRGVEWNTVTREGIGRTVSSSFSFGYDPITEDLLGHSLHSVLHFTSARSAGLSFWESALFPAIGSLWWEAMGEKQLEYPGGWRSKPSTNDFVISSTAGILLGEALHRLSSSVLDDSTHGLDRVGRELLATAVNPMRGVNRLYTGDMWKTGAAPLRPHPLRFSIDLGGAQVRSWQHDGLSTPESTMLVATEIQYGDLLPKKSDGNTLAPLEFFDAYAAMSFFGEEVGTQVYAHGLLYGWSADLSRDTGKRRDNNVFGIVQSFDFQGAYPNRYGALSVGPGDWVQWRFDDRRWLRLGMTAQWTYLAGTESPFLEFGKDHKYVMGGALEENARLELGPAGRVGLRSRHFLTSAIDGQEGREIIWYARASYDVDVLPCVALGFAPTLIHRRSLSEGKTAVERSLDAQLYLRFHN